jgi:ligand-binding sensor domain-containing protein
MNYRQDENLAFLRKKINQIQVALFKTESDFELQLPNNIIQTLRVDDDGAIWFFTTCNGCHARFINKAFYAHLNYYKKDTGCRLHLSGKAHLVSDNENSFIQSADCSKDLYTTVLVKMKIMQAEFLENKISHDVSLAERIKTVFTGLFLPATHRVYNFS